MWAVSQTAAVPVRAWGGCSVERCAVLAGGGHLAAAPEFPCVQLAWELILAVGKGCDVSCQRRA